MKSAKSKKKIKKILNTIFIIKQEEIMSSNKRRNLFLRYLSQKYIFVGSYSSCCLKYLIPIGKDYFSIVLAKLIELWETTLELSSIKYRTWSNLALITSSRLIPINNTKTAVIILSSWKLRDNIKKDIVKNLSSIGEPWAHQR